jgi:cytochrome c oxidase subunit 3
MSAVASTHEHDAAHDHHEVPYAVALRSNRLGLWLFCFSEIFLFGGLLAARFALWTEPGVGIVRPELSQVLGLITTVVLLVSSYFMVRAETAIEHGDRKTFMNSLVWTGALGTLFLFGVVFMEWNIFGLELELFGIEWFGHVKPTDGAFGAVFFGMTGIHAIHVLSGLILIFVVWNNGRKGHYSPEQHWGVEGTAVYWHYVDVVWVFFYPALYLIGHAV